MQEWKSGEYVIEAKTIDKFGEEVKEIKYFTLFSEKEKTPPLNVYDWFSVLKNIGEPGEKAKFLIGTKEKNVKVIYEIEHENNIVKKGGPLESRD